MEYRQYLACVFALVLVVMTAACWTAAFRYRESSNDDTRAGWLGTGGVLCLLFAVFIINKALNLNLTNLNGF